MEGEYQPLPENLIGPPARWESNSHLKDYLYKVSPINQERHGSVDAFPKIIGLDKNWHDILNRMMEETHDGKERSVPFGFESDSQEMLLPKNFLIGKSDASVSLTRREIREKYGIVNVAGSVHSHPRMPFPLVTPEGFSPDDLYRLLQKHGYPMEALVTNEYNYFAFRTIETNKIFSSSTLPNIDAFVNSWYRKYGSIVLGNVGVVPLRPNNHEKMIAGITDAYKLVLYKGERGEDLFRMYS